MQTISRSTFTTVTTEGAILPADLLQRIAEGRELEGLRPADYHLAPNERLNEAISRSWNRLLGVWQGFDEQRKALAEDDRGTTLTRERWLLILFQELGYGRLPFQGSLALDGQNEAGAAYPISHEYDRVPIHLVSLRQPLDRADYDRGESFRRSPHSLVQEFVNRSDHHLWGIVSNGLRLRVLRDNVSFTRAAYLEFDLEAMMAGELYADFSLLWLTVHQSRLEGPPESCWLEKWSREAAEQGTRALESLRDGVQEAIAILGRGFLAHPANAELRRRLQSGELGTQDYYRQLLRLAYRLIFLFVAEDRNLLLVQDADAATREQYLRFYSATRLRELAARQRSGPHPDLYRTLRLVMMLLREGYPPLGLPALGSYLFSGRSTPDLDEADIANEALLDAVRALAFTVENRVLRPVDYKNLGAEELGSVYESLLELHPELNVAAATFDLKTAAGSERKKTGSYYTPTSLINSLLDTALEPVVADRLRGKKGREAEGALLNIKVVDPAAGSGHFLIAAANRLARHLARIRTGDEEPSPEAAREALRDVVRHCIYGVDINEMAVELCKVGLWLETLDPGKPLNFLEANIQCGNSLIGAPPELLEEGIPDAAFTPITGDDKAYCREFKKLNSEQRKGKRSLFTGQSMMPWDRLGNLTAAMQRLEALEDNTVADVKAQEEAYARLVRSQDYEYNKLWADAWCAAFVWVKKPESQGGFPYPITEETFRDIEHNPYAVERWLKDEIRRLAEQYQFFHWHLAFPQVFRIGEPESSGFDVVLGNPPWEMLELGEKEFFAQRSPAIAEASSARKRQNMIEGLQENDPNLYKAFQEAKRGVYAFRHFVQKSDRFPLSAYGRINLYPLFVEHAARITSNRGFAGIIVPSAVSMDAYNAPLFSWIVKEQRLVSLYDFENREGIFEAVDSRYRFCLLTLCGPNVEPSRLDLCYYVLDASELHRTDRHISLTFQELLGFSPNTLAPPILLNETDGRLAKAIYGRFGVLHNHRSGRNPWGVSIQRMLSLSDTGDLFRRYEELGVSAREDEDWMRLYSGKTIHQFDHRFATYEGSWRNSRLAERTNPATTSTTEYYTRKQEVDKRIEGKKPDRWLLGYRDICRATDERTMISSVLPRVGCDTTCRNIYSGVTQVHLLGYFLANLNSFPFDYFARQKVIGTHLNAGVLEQLPVLAPELYTSDCLWVPLQVSAFLVPYILELTYTAYDMRPFAQDLGYQGPPFRWNEERRFLLRCELDAAYFHLYGIDRDDVDYIMDTFPIVRRKDEAEHGEYRTKRVILEIYDEMAEAESTGRPYQTRLDPPPAHPDAAHPWGEDYLGPELPRDQWWQEAEPASPPERRQPNAAASPRATTAVNEPTPALELKSPPARQPQPEPPAPSRPAQPPLVTEFTPLEGSRSQRLKQVMALGDRVKSNRQDATVIAQLVAALADSDESIRWLAGSALGLLGGATVAQTLAAFLAQAPSPEARQEAIKALQRIVDNPREDEAVREMAQKILESQSRGN